MIQKKLSKYALLLVTLFTLTQCSDFLDVNRTPNNPLVVPPSTLLPTGLVGSAFANGNDLNRFASVTMDYVTGAGNAPARYDIYTIDGSDFGNQWNGELYNGGLIAYKRMIDRSEELGAKAYSGIGKIMLAYTFSLATDIWGDVPYSQALLGDEFTQPRVDSQEDIYKGNASLGIVGLFDLTKSGIADLALPTTSTPGVDDLVYGGNIENWVRAGNSLLMKMALQISAREPALATSIINEVIASGKYITNNSQNLSVRFGSAVGSQSPIYTYTYVSSFRNDLIMSTRYVTMLQGLNDPRLARFVTAPTGSFVTADNGFNGTFPTPTTNWSRWSEVVTGVNGVGPVRLITNSQRAFIMAEAAVRLGVTLPAGKTANDYFQEGIRASMTEAGIPAADIDTYFAANAGIVTLSGAAENQIAQIIGQKYIALTGNGLEAWNDWRRTGYPVLPEHQNAVGVDGKRPVRAVYTNNEISRNPNFVSGIVQNVRVWWDAN